MRKISGVYKIVNTVTGDCYVGSSVDVKRRWREHRCSSRWVKHSNYPMYQDMQKYGVDKFRFQILAPVEPEHLKQVEEEFIEMLQPTYNRARSYGLDVENCRRISREWNRKNVEIVRNRTKDWCRKNVERCRERNRNWCKRPCIYNGETLTFDTLYRRFLRQGVTNPSKEAKKYLLTQLWKEGKYDEAVLDVMGLKWNDEKDGVEENI